MGEVLSAFDDVISMIMDDLEEVGVKAIQQFKTESLKQNTGRSYTTTISGRRITKKASTKDETPTARTRKLNRGLTFTVNRTEKYLKFGNREKYAVYLEDGTKHIDARNAHYRVLENQLDYKYD